MKLLETKGDALALTEAMADNEQLMLQNEKLNKKIIIEDRTEGSSRSCARARRAGGWITCSLRRVTTRTCSPTRSRR